MTVLAGEVYKWNPKAMKYQLIHSIHEWKHEGGFVEADFQGNIVEAMDSFLVDHEAALFPITPLQMFQIRKHKVRKFPHIKTKLSFRTHAQPCSTCGNFTERFIEFYGSADVFLCSDRCTELYEAALNQIKARKSK